jgi:Restriction endonuclease
MSRQRLARLCDKLRHLPKSRKRPPNRQSRPRKRGDAYQDAVAVVAKSIAPDADVVVGTWTDGPDGRRDLDVVIRPKRNGSAPMVVIECKDWSRPIGIGFIDALDSKRHDIGATVAVICSNSGFTSDALRKAARVGIPTLSELIEGDKRIRVVVRERIYTRIVEFVHYPPTFHHPSLSASEKAGLEGPGSTKEWSYRGKSLEAWIDQRLLQLASTATRSRSFSAKYRFLQPIGFDIRGLCILVSGIDIRAAFTVQWMTQVAEVGASQGMYDYLRKIVLVGPGPCQLHLKNVNTQDWGSPVAIEEVPPRLLIPPDERANPGTPLVEMTLGMIKNLRQSDPKDAPDLDPLIFSEDVVDEVGRCG